MTLTDFLLARIAEGEADAWAASGLRAEAFTHTRAWRECEAKRRIVERHTAPSRDGQYDPECTEDGYGLASPNDCPTLRILAAVYADHEDFREEWKP